MIRWLLDTNVVAEITRKGGSQRVKAWAVAEGEAALCISVLTLAEYDKGIANLPEDDQRRLEHMALRDELQGRFKGRILSVSDAVVRRWGAVTGDVRRRTGHPPPVVDTLLAATAIEHGLTLVTRNVRDVRLSGAVVFDPWVEGGAGKVRIALSQTG